MAPGRPPPAHAAGGERFPSDDPIRHFFLRFSQAHIEAFWRPLGRWLVRLGQCPAGGFARDLDSTGFCREGQQEGARKGFNPKRKGRNSHHPLLAVLAEAPFLLHGWLRSGHTGAARGVVPFLQEALALLPEGMWLRTVRADSGFFDGAFLDFLEERALPYVVVARLTTTLQRKCAGIQHWTVIDEPHAAGEFTLKLLGWSKERRFVVVRERMRESQAAVGRKLLDVPGYTFRIWVPNRSESAVALWRDDNGRACVEQRIAERKHDLAADGFCLQPFYATEAAFLAVLFTFNLRSLYQHQTTPTAAYRQPGTLRVAVFLCGAVLGVMGRAGVIKLSAAWGGLRKHKPLVDATLNWRKVASPKLIPPEDRLAIGGGLI
jgi:hypothetical protein